MSYRWLIRLAHTFDIACSISLPELRTFGGESPAIFELQSQVAGSRLVCGVRRIASSVCQSVFRNSQSRNQLTCSVCVTVYCFAGVSRNSVLIYTKRRQHRLRIQYVAYRCIPISPSHASGRAECQLVRFMA